MSRPWTGNWYIYGSNDDQLEQKNVLFDIVWPTEKERSESTLIFCGCGRIRTIPVSAEGEISRQSLALTPLAKSEREREMYLLESGSE